MRVPPEGERRPWTEDEVNALGYNWLYSPEDNYVVTQKEYNSDGWVFTAGASTVDGNLYYFLAENEQQGSVVGYAGTWVTILDFLPLCFQ